MVVWPKVLHEVKVNLGADGLTFGRIQDAQLLLVWFCLNVLVKSPAIGADIKVGSVWHRSCLV